MARVDSAVIYSEPIVISASTMVYKESICWV